MDIYIAIFQIYFRTSLNIIISLSISILVLNNKSASLLLGEIFKAVSCVIDFLITISQRRTIKAINLQSKNFCLLHLAIVNILVALTGYTGHLSLFNRSEGCPAFPGSTWWWWQQDLYLILGCSCYSSSSSREVRVSIVLVVVAGGCCFWIFTYHHHH